MIKTFRFLKIYFKFLKLPLSLFIQKKIQMKEYFMVLKMFKLFSNSIP